MTQKEKARSYDEALERAKDFMNGKVHYELKIGENIMCWIFPELRESEDEKIRKALIQMVHDTTGDELWVDYNVHKEEALAWLEKQSEPTEINPTEFDLRLNKLLEQFESLPKEELICNLSYYLNVIQNDGTYKIEKQGKQKLTWSEDEEVKINRIVACLENLNVADNDILLKDIDWLKSLKGRVQPKQEWSEEGEAHINSIIDYLLDYKLLVYEEDMNVANGVQKELDWLNSLKQRIGG